MNPTEQESLETPSRSDSTSRPFEEFRVGEVYYSPVKVVQFEEIERFAELSRDLNPIHLDPEFARSTVFRGPVAHGMFLVAVMTGMAYQAGLLGRNTLALESSSEEFLLPVRPGDQVVGTVTIAGLEPDASKRCGRVSWSVKLLKRVEGAEDQVAVRGEWKTLIFKRKYMR